MKYEIADNPQEIVLMSETEYEARTSWHHVAIDRQYIRKDLVLELIEILRDKEFKGATLSNALQELDSHFGYNFYKW